MVAPARTGERVCAVERRGGGLNGRRSAPSGQRAALSAGAREVALRTRAIVLPTASEA